MMDPRVQILRYLNEFKGTESVIPNGVCTKHVKTWHQSNRSPEWQNTECVKTPYFNWGSLEIAFIVPLIGVTWNNGDSPFNWN